MRRYNLRSPYGVQLVQLPTEVLCLIANALYQTVRGRERIAFRTLLRSRLISKFWAIHGAQTLLVWFRTSDDRYRGARSTLTFSCESASLEMFLTVAKNPIIAQLVRKIRVARNDYRGFLPDPDIDLETFRAHHETVHPQHPASVGIPSISGDQVRCNAWSLSFKAFRVRSTEAIASIDRLLLDNRSDLESCVRNLVCVEFLAFEGVGVDVGDEEKVLYYWKQRPRARYYDEVYWSMLPQAFLKTGVPVGNMFSHQTARYLAIQCPNNKNIYMPSHGISFDAVAFQEKTQYTDKDYEVANAIGTGPADRIVLRNHFQSDDGHDFDALCDRVLGSLRFQSRLFVINLHGVRVSLALFSAALGDLKQQGHIIPMIRLLNVRATDKSIWRSFLECLTEMFNTQQQSQQSYVKECPHPATSGGSKEWEYIKDIVDEYAGTGFCADLSRYLYRSRTH